jgi:hypothetical protein
MPSDITLNIGEALVGELALELKKSEEILG